MTSAAVLAALTAASEVLWAWAAAWDVVEAALTPPPAIKAAPASSKLSWTHMALSFGTAPAATRAFVIPSAPTIRAAPVTARPAAAPPEVAVAAAAATTTTALTTFITRGESRPRRPPRRAALAAFCKAFMR